MNTSARYILLVLALLISLHWILRLTHDGYGRATSLQYITSHLTGDTRQPDRYNLEDYYKAENSTHLVVNRRANASFVILARNSDLDGTVRSIREIEDRFNKYHGYPYVLLNEEQFTDEFKTRVSVLTNSKMEFGQIPRDHWYQPTWIDEEKAKEGRKQMEDDNIIYGGSVSYRNMCRFNSGFFFRHELLQKYRWYWRIEPDVHFHCDISFDPFLFMEDNNKIYSFTITMFEFEKTIPTLWHHVKEFADHHPQYIADGNSMGFLSDDAGNKYNLCHFWSNFEIADMDFWRGPAYTDFFNYLDGTGGFYYERWGDAPVHSIAAALFAKKEQIHFWDEIGYEHNPYTHCPQKEEAWKQGKCSCSQQRSFDYDGYSCMRRWDQLMAK
ncbi:glycosyltransferase family 15 protein [Amanita rubescens]|nr:glycosyltransferase family 15 protein [Amanita rubescens]